MIWGHLAVSALLHRYLGVELGATVAGGVFPDVTDKLLCQVLRITPSGRMYGHTLLSVALTTLLVWQVWGARAARAWALGYLGHLLADARGFIPWLYPFRRYEFEEGEPGILDIMLRAVRDPVRISIESGLLIWAVAALVVRPQPGPKGKARSGDR